MARYIKITQIRSTIGRPEKQERILQALGLHKRGKTRILPDNEAVRGMIMKVSHLVAIEPYDGEVEE